MSETAILYAVSHVTGSVSTPNNALGAFDGTFTTDGNNNTNWTSRWRLDTLSGSPTGTQTITLRLRKGSNSGNPSVSSVQLWQNDTSLATLTLASGSTTISSTTSQDLVYTFASSLLSGLSNVDIQVATSSAGGSPTARNAVEIDGIRWDISYDPPPPDLDASGSIPTPKATISGSTSLKVFASGSVLTPPTSLLGVGTVAPLTLTGNMSTPPLEGSGVAKIYVSSQGTLTSAAFNLIGDQDPLIGNAIYGQFKWGRALWGVVLETASGSLQTSLPVFSGSAAISFTKINAVGEIATPTVEFFGQTTQTLTSSGSISSPKIEISGVTLQAVKVSGALLSPPVNFSGEAAQTITSSGSINTPSVKMLGSLSEIRTASGAINLSAFSFSGLATLGTFGEISTPLPLFQGQASQVVFSAGSLETTVPTFLGTSNQTNRSTGTITTALVSLTGEGLAEINHIKVGLSVPKQIYAGPLLVKKAYYRNKLLYSRG